jgi:hypothetical protein
VVVVVELLLWRRGRRRRPAEDLGLRHGRAHAPHATARLEHHARSGFLTTAGIPCSLLHHSARRATANPRLMLLELLVVIVDEHADLLVVVVAVTTHRSIDRSIREQLTAT